jgi:predicted PolB exonuclease-like 3'-5' exonuclease
MPNPHNPDSVEKTQFMADTTNWFAFDIETGVRPEVLASPDNWFKPDARLTDPVKIKASLADKASDGALSPVTGEILAIGYSNDGNDSFHVGSEKAMIERWMDRAHASICHGNSVVGWNILDFDIPFLLYRARANGVLIRPSLGSIYRGKYQPSDRFVDLMLLSMFGKYDRAGHSLDRVARSFGFSGKNGDGKFFSQVLKEDPTKAEQYLMNDMRMTRQLAEVLL